MFTKQRREHSEQNYEINSLCTIHNIAFCELTFAHYNTHSLPFSFLLPYSMPFNNKNKEGHRIREEGAMLYYDYLKQLVVQE